MKCPQCSREVAGGACDVCGWRAEASALPPVRWFDCLHCEHCFAYRSTDPTPKVLCHRCSTNPQWYAEHCDLPRDGITPVGAPVTPADDEIAEPDYFPRLIFEHARKHQMLITEAARQLALAWLEAHASDPECERVRHYLVNFDLRRAFEQEREVRRRTEAA